MGTLDRVRRETQDTLRWHSFSRRFLYYWALRGAQSLKPANSVASIAQLCRAARLAPNGDTLLRVEMAIRERLCSLNLAALDWRMLIPDVENRRIEKAVILKPRMSDAEKGVIFVSFEEQWARLLWNCNLEELASRYSLVIAPTWSPPHSLINVLFPAVYPGHIFCLISNASDTATFQRLSDRYVVVPLFASSWVNPQLYGTVPFERRDISIIMLANFGEYKRHFLLFRALRRMPSSVRALLIGQENGNRNAKAILNEAESYGVKHKIELLVNASDQAVVDALERARISVIFSRREGSCVAVVESMFANTPVGIFEDAEIGSRVYINEATGRFLRYNDLSTQLMDFISTAHKYSPRAFAQKNLSCFHSTTVLNERLKSHALSNGQEWTRDIAVHHWRPDPQLLYSEDRIAMQSSYDDIKNRFGVAFGKD